MFHTAHFCNKRNTVCAKYTINGFPLNYVSGVKYFRASINCKVSWSHHIDDICRKVRKSLRFIRRNLRNCPQYARSLAYISLIRRILEYACCVLDTYQRKHIKRLERVQHHVARFITENYHSENPWCATNMVAQLGWDLLEHRRAKHRITMFHEIILNHANIPVHHQLKEHDSSTCSSASHNFRKFSKI